MRLSTSFIFSLNKNAVLSQQSKVSHIGNQVSTGRRVVNPSDDPEAAAQSITLSHAKHVNEQFTDTRATARRKLGTELNTLKSVTNTITAAKTRLVQAGNGALSDDNRQSLADQLDGLYDQLKSDANATDGNGNYLFSGYQTGTKAVSSNNQLLDAKTQKLQVSGSREMRVQDTAKSVFRDFTANARYVGQAGNGNSGSAIFKNLNIENANAADYGKSFKIEFNSPNTYTVTTKGGGTSSPQSYTPGDTINLGSAGKVQIDGTAAAGDTFTFRNNNDSANNFGTPDNLLQTLKNAANALRSNTSVPEQAATLHNALSTARVALDNGLNQVSSVRASAGVKLNALDTLDDVGSAENLNYKNNLSRIQDVNAYSALSKYSLAKLALQFSQKTYQDVNKLSLFSLRN